MATAIPAGFRALPLPLVQLSLAAALKCGQSFRWSIFPLVASSSDDSPSLSPLYEYRFCLRDRVICLQQSQDTLFYRSVFPEVSSSTTEEAKRETETLAWLRDYFQLDIDLMALYEEWSKRDPVFAKFRSRFEGIRMLRQDPWENLVSFICSSNNNISRITKMVQSLCKQYSPPLLSMPSPCIHSDTAASLEQYTYHPFPPPSALSKPEVASVLRSLGFGYRAEFIQRTAKMLVDEHGSSVTSLDPSEPSEKWLQTLRSVDTASARTELLRYVGVGRKVADCILLMSLDKREVIPVDTHVHQIAIKYYGLRGSSGAKQNMTPKLYEEVNLKLMNIWGEYAGWAHSVLFTADLKSFSSYGLLTPSPSKTPIKGESLSEQPMLSTPPAVPSPSPLKRKRGRPAVLQSSTATLTAIKSEVDASKDILASGMDATASLAERVKKRRRVVSAKAS